MNILPMPTRATPAPNETLAEHLERLKSSSLIDAEVELASARVERAAAAQALRDAIAAMQQRSPRPRGSEDVVVSLDAALHEFDARIAKARAERDKHRRPLGDAIRQAMAPRYGDAARLVRAAEASLSAARDILLVAETFSASNGIDLTPFASRLPSGLDAVAEQLEARAK